MSLRLKNCQRVYCLRLLVADLVDMNMALIAGLFCPRACVRARSAGAWDCNTVRFSVLALSLGTVYAET